MKTITALFVIALCGLLFYSCAPCKKTFDVGYLKDTDSVKFIYQNTNGDWFLDKLNFRVVNNKTIPKFIKVCIDPDIVNMKETILFFQKGITNKQEYKLNASNDWCSDKIVITANLLNGKKDTTFTFAGIVNYKDTLNSNAKYIYGRSVCKIKITY